MSANTDASHQGGTIIHSATLMGPVRVSGADKDLLPLLTEIIAVISSAAIHLTHVAANDKDLLGSSRRLSALAALCACGELRALLLLATSGLEMQARIHLRSLDDCMKRLVVYYRDRSFAAETEQSLPRFQADGLVKLDEESKARMAARDEEAARRFDEMIKDADTPPLITKNAAYKRTIVGSLDPFQHWFYSQVEHGTPIALAEISNRLSRYSENIYHTGESAQLLVTAIGMGLTIVAYLASLGVDVRGHYKVLEARLFEMLSRTGMTANADPKGN